MQKKKKVQKKHQWKKEEETLQGEVCYQRKKECKPVYKWDCLPALKQSNSNRLPPLTVDERNAKVLAY